MRSRSLLPEQKKRIRRDLDFSFSFMNSIVAQCRQFFTNRLFNARVQFRQACLGVHDFPHEKGPLNIQTRGGGWGIGLRALCAALWRQQSQNQQKATCPLMDCDRYILLPAARRRCFRLEVVKPRQQLLASRFLPFGRRQI